jgi:DNA end-binding protein Ku
MLFADEIRPTKDVNAATQKAHKPTRRELEVAVALIEELSCEFEPEKYKDEYRARLKRVVARKRKGETITAPEKRDEPSPPSDLLDALERTLEEMKQGGSGRWSDTRERE